MAVVPAAPPAFLLVLSLACVLALLAATAPAHAAFPGGNGKIAFTIVHGPTEPSPSTNSEIQAMNPDGSGEMNLTNQPGDDYHPAWSPDGGRIAFASVRDGNPEIYVMNGDGSAQTRLTNNVGRDYEPAWSPDGQRIAFASERDGNIEIYVMNSDGSAQRSLTGGEDFLPAWSPDGGRIAFASYRDGNSEIYLMNADGSGETRLTNNVGSDYGPAWSPDGGRIAFNRERDGIGEIYVMNADGSGETRLTTNPQAPALAPAWSPDGGRIAFASGDIYVMNADGSGETRLTCDLVSTTDPDWQPVPDGAAPPPDPAECARTLGLWYSEKKGKFRGTLYSYATACIAQQKVSVHEKKKGKDPKVGSARTRKRVYGSRYSLKEKNAEGKFYAKVKRTTTASEICLAAKSKKIKVG